MKNFESRQWELVTISLSRIARENPVNYDDATIYNDKNPDIS